MLTLLSPAKKLLTYKNVYNGVTTRPQFEDKTAVLVNIMQGFSVEEIARLMDLSVDLAELNFQRYQHFSTNDTSGYPAIYLFQGDVYKGLNAETWSSATVNFAQKHLMILSGLYGLIRPLDKIQPYRLEMGTSLANPAGKNLYDYWSATVTTRINELLAKEENPVLINLASTEYFSVVKASELKYPLITIHFKEKKNGQLKVIGIYAKKARGAMASFLMQDGIDNVEGIKAFNGLNYQYAPLESNEENLVFIR